MLCLREIFYIVKGYYYIVNFINVYMCKFYIYMVYVQYIFNLILCIVSSLFILLIVYV